MQQEALVMKKLTLCDCKVQSCKEYCPVLCTVNSTEVLFTAVQHCSVVHIQREYSISRKWYEVVGYILNVCIL